MDLWTYLAQREREVRSLSAHPADFEAAEEKHSGGTRGRLLGRAWFNDTSYLQMHEVVVIENSSVHRLKYAYYLCINDEEVGGYERDPSHAPDVHHMHCSERTEHERLSAGRVTFAEAVAKAWDYLSGLYDGPLTDDAV